MLIIEKVCSICKKQKDFKEFYKNKTAPDGLFPYCKKCAIEKTKKWASNNYERFRENSKKSNFLPQRSKEWTNNSRNSRKNGYYSQWQENNKNKIRNYRKKYSSKKHTITERQWVYCKEYFNNCCAYCGLPIEKHYIKYKGKLKKGDFHKEHVIHNGKNDLSNCVPSCKICNSSKRYYSLQEWYNINNSNFNKDRLNKIYKWINEDYKLYL